MVKIIISIRTVFVVLLLAVLLFAAGGIYAFNGATPSSMGHSIGELQPPFECEGYLRYSVTGGWSCFSFTPSSSCSGSNEVVQWTGSSWGCGIVNI